MYKRFILITGIPLMMSFCSVFCKHFDQMRTVPQIIEARGFKCEKHYVTTADGYISEIHRIINPNSNVKATLRRPLILQHGLLSSSAIFVLNSAGLGTENSDTHFDEQIVSNTLAFALSMFDYDVWLTNSRGNEYSISHTTLNTKSHKFWEFSLDEMIEFDLPASIEYILRETSYDSLGYIGYSQGTAIMFGLLASKPEYSKIIKPVIALAPVARVDNVKTPARYLANPLTLSYFDWRGGQFLKYFTSIVTTVGQIACQIYALASMLCANIYFLFYGFDSSEMDMARIPVYLAHLPAPASTRNVVHFAQMVNSKKFSKFDYGKHGNLKKYGTITPPQYNLRKIKSRYIALFSSENDWMATPKGVDFIRRELKGKIMVDYVVPYKHWNHIDFVFGKHTAKYVNVVVLDILNKFATNHSHSVSNHYEQ